MQIKKTDLKPSECGFKSERKKEGADMELSRTAEAEWSELLLTKSRIGAGTPIRQEEKMYMQL